MPESDRPADLKVDRRGFIRAGLVAGGAAVGAGLAVKALTEGNGSSSGSAPTPATGPSTPPRQRTHHRPSAKPNILVIMVDQLRFPQWFGPQGMGIALPPNIARLRRGGVSFGHHYTAANDCTPARSTILTGLYTHQTGCMITGGSTLDPGFPTWGTLLREHGYQTRWLGKWHLTHHDNRWNPTSGETALERYGFAGGVYPSPDGGPGQGSRVDPHITRVFRDWFTEEGRSEPWCTTVSLVNPHDIAWWYLWTDRVPAEMSAPHLIHRLPPNYETPEQLTERRKPRLQHSLQDTAATSFGPVPFEGPECVPIWMEFLDLYLKLQRVVDGHIGHVLETLESDPEVAANTVVVFTSDHGEYGSSHGLRGKGASAYEEALRVPLIVKDPRGRATAAPGVQRNQLTSSVDVVPLLLSIATGSNEWRREPHYSYLAGRADLARIMLEPTAPGREFVVHATDEQVTEYAIEPYAADAPLHVVAVRTPDSKFATYSNWPVEGIVPLTEGEEAELYDYDTVGGRLEIHNTAGSDRKEDHLRAEHERAFFHELREPLPHYLQAAHGRGFADYFSTARHSATAAAARRKRREERLGIGPRGIVPEPEREHFSPSLGPTFPGPRQHR